MSVDKSKGFFTKLIARILESKIAGVIHSIMSLNKDNSKHDQEFKELMYASESSMDFWNNDIDDEVWNNISKTGISQG